MITDNRAVERDRVRGLLLAMPQLTMGCGDDAFVAAANECCDRHRGISARRAEALAALEAYAGAPTLNAILNSDLGEDVALSYAGPDPRMRAYVLLHYDTNPQPPGTGKSTIISQIGPVWGWLHGPGPRVRWGAVDDGGKAAEAAPPLRELTHGFEDVGALDFQEHDK